jgi:hypothetical protein
MVNRHPLAAGLVGLWFPAGGSLILDLTGARRSLIWHGSA